jgi:hypothetical protein
MILRRLLNEPRRKPANGAAIPLWVFITRGPPNATQPALLLLLSAREEGQEGAEGAAVPGAYQPRRSTGQTSITSSPEQMYIRSW